MSGKIVKGGGIPKPQEGQGASPSISRAAASLPDAGGIVHRRVLDASAEADRILQAARDEAQRIRAEAEQVLEDAKATRAQELKRGYSEGEAKGLKQVTEKLVELAHLKERFFDQAEPEVMNLVMDIAEKIIGHLVEQHAEVVRSVVRQALERTIGDRILVRVNPEDYRTLMEGDHEFRDVIDRTRRLSFREDESLQRGGCIVETEVGTIDAQLETQIAAIKKALVVS